LFIRQKRAEGKMQEGKKHILIVDDSPGIQFSFARLFEQRLPGSIQISFAFNGLQGIEKASELHPDPMILDGKMPVMNGLETISPS
jgi:CheY-like chemotaxis protein